jgi:V8-like Glu-specific endopeptidase
MKLMLEKLVFISALLLSTLSLCSIKTALAQNTGMPSPIDGTPIKLNFPLGFGDDNRIPMRSSSYPWSAVGQVQIDGGGHCTGALIGRDLVLTNAHCIWENGKRTNITFAPNYKNKQSPEKVRGIRYWWGTSDPSKNRGADWAIIRLEQPIGDRYGSFGWQALSYQDLKGKSVNYVGYSTFENEKVEEFINGETAQVHLDCRVRDVDANDGVIHTDCDNGRGGSGGPIFIWQNNKPIIVGINAAEYRSGGSSYFTQNYTPGRGNVGVPILTFSKTLAEATVISQIQGVHNQIIGGDGGPLYVNAAKDILRRGTLQDLRNFLVDNFSETPIQRVHNESIGGNGGPLYVDAGKAILRRDGASLEDVRNFLRRDFGGK